MHLTTRARRRLAPVAIAAVLGLSLAACGDDDDAASDTTAAAPVTEAPTTEAPTTDAPAPTTSHADHQTVAVDGIDYGYENLPAEVPAGTMLSFTNTSDVEAHELVAFRLPDEETRSVDELMQLPPEELFAMFSGPPAMVLIAGPGEEGMAVEGDGTLTEPGRYLIGCAIPIGADPAEIMAPPDSSAPEQTGPPEAAGGPPHFTAGMYAELTVTA